eukprot:UN06491
MCMLCMSCNTSCICISTLIVKMHYVKQQHNNSVELNSKPYGRIFTYKCNVHSTNTTTIS